MSRSRSSGTLPRPPLFFATEKLDRDQLFPLGKKAQGFQTFNLLANTPKIGAMSCVSSVLMSHPSLHQDCLQSFSFASHSPQHRARYSDSTSLSGKSLLTEHWLLSWRAGEESGTGAVTTEMLLAEYQRQPVKQRALWSHLLSLIYSTTSITLFFELLET